MQIFVKLLSTDIKLSKIQLSKIVQSRGFLGRLLGPLLNTGSPLMKNVIKQLAKIILIPLWWTAAKSAPDSGIHKKTFRFRKNCTNNIKLWNGRHYKNS